MNNLKIGQTLISTSNPEWGTWTISEISTDIDGDIYYTVKGFSGEFILWPSQITRGLFTLIK